MKKIFLLIATAIIAHSAYSQAAASLRGGLDLIDGSTSFGPGVSFQYGLNENMVIGGNFDYHFGENSSYLMNFEPRFDYYLNSAFNGLHIGSNLSYAISGVTGYSNGQLALGALAGYSHPLNDNLFIDLSCGGAYFLDSKAFGVRPTLSLGYKFGGN